MNLLKNREKKESRRKLIILLLIVLATVVVVLYSTTIVYMCTASDMKCRDFERDFIKYIEKNDLYDSFVYLNLSDQDLTAFSKDFNKKYNCKGKFKPNYPSFVSFEDGVVKNILQAEENEMLDIDNVDSFVDLTKEEDPFEYE